MICPKCFKFQMLTGGCPNCDSIGNVFHEQITKENNDRLNKAANKSMKEFYTGLVSDQESIPLTTEILAKNISDCKRKFKHIYILSSEYLPDDCYGILMLRPEDAKQWRKDKT